MFSLVYFIGIRVPEETIRDVVKNAGPFGPLVIIFLIWLTHVIAPLGASPLLFAGFYLYEQEIVIFAFIAALIAIVTNFWIARIWGKSIVTKLLGSESLEKIDHLTENYGFQTLIIVRVFLREFHDIISYVFGLTTMKFTPYLLISVLGMIPGTLIWYYLSSKIQNPLVFTLLSLGVAYTFLSLYLLWIKITKKEKGFSKPNKEI